MDEPKHEYQYPELDSDNKKFTKQVEEAVAMEDDENGGQASSWAEDDDEYDEYYADDDKESCNCDCCVGTGDMVYEVVCPTCGKTIALSEDAVEKGSMKCPECDELLEFDYNDEEDNQE